MAAKRSVEAAARLIAETYYGEDGLWLCDAFEAINREFFRGSIPYPLITIELTNYGRCLGWCSSAESRPPRIAIHPTSFAPGESNQQPPWGITTRWLGRCFAFDCLLHECIHAYVFYIMGGYDGPTSHNNEQWVGEVNRLAPLLGIRDVEAGRQVAKRVAVPGTKSKRGKQKTRVQKVTEGNVPFTAIASFPLGLRIHRNAASRFYRSNKLPIEVGA